MLPIMNALSLATMLLAACSVCASAQPVAAHSTSQAPAAPALKAWFIRLIPPRPNFDKSLTESERGIMDRHFIYWKDLNEKGVCVFGGPVLDPKGVWGMLAIKAATEDEARAIASGDPAVKEGEFKIEVAEMRIVYLPKKRPE
jgi:uncharacterized protein